MSEHQADCVLCVATVSDGQGTAAVLPPPTPPLGLTLLSPSLPLFSEFVFGDCNFRPVTIFVTL